MQKGNYLLQHNNLRVAEGLHNLLKMFHFVVNTWLSLVPLWLLCKLNNSSPFNPKTSLAFWVFSSKLCPWNGITGRSRWEWIQAVEKAKKLTCFPDAFPKLRKATISFVISVCPVVCLSVWNNSAPIGRILMKLDIWVLVEKFQVLLKSDKNDGYFTWWSFDMFDVTYLNCS
jgi:hypothetical protein